MEDRRFAAIGGLLLIPAAVLVLTAIGYFLAILYCLYLIFALQDAPTRLWLAILTPVSLALGLLHVYVVREFFRKKQTVPELIQGLYLPEHADYHRSCRKRAGVSAYRWRVVERSHLDRHHGGVHCLLPALHQSQGNIYRSLASA